MMTTTKAREISAMSNESTYADRMATAYGPKICRLDRAGRMAWAQEIIGRLQRESDVEREAHERECELCLRGAFCLYGFTLSPRYDQTMRLRGMIEMEKRDQGYADRARTHGVVHEDHVLNGFCAYWQNVRHRLFCAVGWKCEGCDERRPLEAHHCTEGDPYAHLGFEEISDLQALCRECHEKAGGRWR